MPVEPLRPNDPRELGAFRLLGRLGAGGMGVAFLSERGSEWAVVKMFRSEVSEDSGFAPRMARELEAMQLAAGPHTATLLEYDLDGHPAWFAMEFIPGMTLSSYVEASGPLAGAALTDFADQLRTAIQAIHEAGLIHRDLKPSNIILSPDGPRLIDFGIAEVSDATQLTATGHVLGTIGWLAPEQVSGDQVTTATDMHAWALCVMFAATGEIPFGSGPVPVTMNRVLHEIPEVPMSIPRPLRGDVLRALEKDPARRISDDPVTTEFVAQPTMDNSTTVAPASSRKPLRLLAAVGALALVAAAGGVAWAVTSGQGSAPTQVAAPTSSAAPAEALESSQDPQSSTVPVTATEPKILEPLASPAGLKTTAQDGSATLKWDPVKGASSYAVLKKTSTGKYEEVLTVSADSVNANGLVSAKIKNLTNDRKYTFAVEARSDGRDPGRSRDVTVRPKAPTEPTTVVAEPDTTYTYPSDVGGGPGDAGTTPDPGPTLVMEGDPNELVLKP